MRAIIWIQFEYSDRRDEAEQLKAANNSLRLEIERFHGLESQLQVLFIHLLHCKWENYIVISQKKY